mmetsp:Transcript_3303/g.9423  ORF Transcript_3303/g.9423 Transcript_3303/m.9423 type:complete len:218 (+) Transcript_3303:1977-2630(+)
MRERQGRAGRAALPRQDRLPEPAQDLQHVPRGHQLQPADRAPLLACADGGGVGARIERGRNVYRQLRRGLRRRLRRGAHGGQRGLGGGQRHLPHVHLRAHLRGPVSPPHRAGLRQAGPRACCLRPWSRQVARAVRKISFPGHGIQQCVCMVQLPLRRRLSPAKWVLRGHVPAALLRSHGHLPHRHIRDLRPAHRLGLRDQILLQQRAVAAGPQLAAV